MKTFHCTHCQNLVFFENTRCLNCDNLLAFAPDRGTMAALTRGDNEVWSLQSGDVTASYRLCGNYTSHDVCNWAVPAEDPGILCPSCRLTTVIPDLTQAGNQQAWFRLETAKRRLVYTLLELGLPLTSRSGATRGLAFEFLKESTQPNGDSNRVLTGHDNGLITINVAEADDVQREQQRTLQNEPYRTVLGHFRHEIGHYYWDQLIDGSDRLEAFRNLFGDERADYGQSLQRHYSEGAPPGWQQDHVSAYATMHPWEDWAETWAHFLHMLDVLETAGSAGLRLKPQRRDEPSVTVTGPQSAEASDFDRMIEQWGPLTYVLNNLNRGLGLPDAYPFVLNPPVIAKLRFIAETIFAHSTLTAPVTSGA